MASVRLVLASGSPARLALLRTAGVEPEVIVSEVDEDALTETLGSDDPAVIVEGLARAKAETVASRIDGTRRDTVVLGCDSMFTIDGTNWGKPLDPDRATARIRTMRDHAGVLRTGHCLIDLVTGATVAGVEATTVRFGPMTDSEIDAYVATGEPLRVAGSFTLDGRSAPFIDAVEGDPSNVIGLSLPTLRRLMAEVGRSVTDLWEGP